jgi:hypothetical protein
MAIKSPVPCRVTVFVARQAQVAVILRRGPTRWVELILWDTKKDLFQRGQWFHGRVYEERCDLSPDGTKFIHFAAKYGRKRDADMPDTWTAISKPPYFTALALWPGIGTWGGGGRFLDNQCLWHADCSPIHPRFSLKGLVEVSDEVAAVSFDDKFRNDRLYLRLRQVGWEVAEQKGSRLLKWRRTSPVGRGELLLDRSFSAARYYLVVANRSEPLAFDAEWADWDQKGRLIVANRGKVLAGNWNRHKGLYFEELADFNEDRPASVEAPDWAQHW